MLCHLAPFPGSCNPAFQRCTSNTEKLGVAWEQGYPTDIKVTQAGYSALRIISRGVTPIGTATGVKMRSSCQGTFEGAVKRYAAKIERLRYVMRSSSIDHAASLATAFATVNGSSYES